MNELLSEVVEAHGGTGRWQELTQARATLVSGGDLFAIKGLPQDVTPRTMTVRLHEEYASVQPFGAHDQKTGFTAGRVSIEKLDGHVVAERVDPRASFAGHTLETPWDPLDRAYFNGYALWTYLTTPFLLAMPGFTVTDIEPWREGDEVWPGLRATFPPRIASHSTHQDFYFGPDRLLRRHDYHVDVAADSPPPSTSTTSRKRTASCCPPDVGPTAATPTVAPSWNRSWSPSTSATSTSADTSLLSTPAFPRGLACREVIRRGRLFTHSAL
ncbi:hypothetical protein ACFQ51_48115 [Streptomyces kaempferi]